MIEPKWTTALPDWESRIVAGESLVPCPPLFRDEAEEALRMFRALKIVDAPGSPTMEEACRRWVFDFVAAIFGAYNPETGRRLINEFFLLISKKNSKSTIAAGIMVTALLRNWRKSAEFIIIAPTIEIANNSAGPAMDMVENDPDLLEILKPIRHLRTIEHRTTKATLKILAADSEVVSGKKATGILIDELWLFGSKVKAEAMLREAKGGLASRPEGFVIALSTQGDDPPAGVFLQWLSRFRNIRDGKLRAPKSMGVLYEFPQAMLDAEEHLDPANFYVTNPNLGASVDDEYLLDEFEKAKANGEGSVRGFLSKHLNVQIGQNLRADRWVGADYWQKAADRMLTLDALLDRCEVATVGIDGGGMDDLLGLTVLGREKVTRRWLSWSHAWCHEKVLENRKQIASQLRDYEKAKDLTILPDDSREDVAQVVEIVERVRESGRLGAERSIGLDRVGLPDIVDEMERSGFTATTDDAIGQLLAIRQGYELQTAILTAERRLSFGDLLHADQTLMTWCVSNAKAERKGNAVMITKAAAGVAKIDPLIALFNAVACMSLNPVAGGKSFWE